MLKRTRFPHTLAALLLVVVLLAGCGQGGPTNAPATTAAPTLAPTPTPTPEPTPTPTPRPILTITSVFPGEEPKGLPAVFEVLNQRLGEEIFGRLELSWSPAEEYDNANATAAAAGTVDFAWIKSSALSEYVEKQLVAPLDDLLATSGQAVLENSDARLLETMKFGGKLMGIPSAGNVPLCDAGNVLVIRSDLLQKHGLSQPDSLAAIEQYFRTIKEKEPELTPVAATNAALAIMKAYGAEEILPGTGYAVATAFNGDGTVTCLNLQDAEGFKGAVTRVRAWYKAGWLPKDMPAIKDSPAMLTGGTSAAAGGKAMSGIELQKAILEKVPEASLTEAPVFGQKKYLASDGGSALCLASTSKSPEMVVQFWAWVLGNQDNYDLFCYGIEHVNFEIADDRLAVLDDSYSAFPAKVFDNLNYRRFPAGVSDEYIDTLKRWNDGAEVSPLMGFVFDATAVKNEVAKTKAVYSSYSILLNAGSVDTAVLLAELSAKMKAAGQGKIIAEAQAQIDAFLAGKN